MKVVDIPFFLELGATLESAENVEADSALFDVLFKLYPLGQQIQALLGGHHGKLSASEHYLQDLLSTVTSFERNHFRDPEGKWRSPSDDEKSEYEVGVIVGKIKQLRTILIAELRTASAFSVTSSGIFDINQLVNGAHKALDQGTIAKLDAATCEELDAAGKCLAFNLFTAAGFHSMRAIERVIKTYLSHFLSKDEIDRLNNWGQYIQTLEKVSKGDGLPKPSDEAIALLRQIKDIYRNPVIHPERVLNSIEAATIFHSTIAAISRIVSEFRVNEPLLDGLFGPAGTSAVSQALRDLRVVKRSSSAEASDPSAAA